MIKNKKRIRGWKRRINQVDRWFQRCQNADLESFLSLGEVYVKIRIDPWNRLHERTPPIWYFKLIVARLIQIHHEWKKAFDKSGVAYDLQIWLNDPHTQRSQVVCAHVDLPGETRSNYYRKSKEQKDFPYEKWGNRLYNLADFDWELHDDEVFVFKNSDELQEAEIKNLLRNGFSEERIALNEQEEVQFRKRVGDVWIGRLGLASNKDKRAKILNRVKN